MADQQQPDWQRLVDLLRPFHAQAAGVARRLAGSAADGDDLFQETVLRALGALPGLRDANRFRPWFFAILLSVHRNRTRGSFWRRFLPLDAGAGFDASHGTGGGAPRLEPAGEDGSTWEEERQRAQRVSRALAGLPAVQREAVVLFELEGFSIEEIATLQRVSISAVKSRLARGRARLRRIYQRWGFGSETVSSPAQPPPPFAAPALARAQEGGEERP
jgi:RNA polymerase sigma-70 factor (ECF subfamily)